MEHRILTVLLFPSLLALDSFLQYGRAQKDAEMIITPKRSLYFVGENVTLLCDLYKRKVEDLEYRLFKDGRELSYSQNPRFNISLTSLEAGKRYQCLVQHGSYTKAKSKILNVAVAARPKAKLIINSISDGGMRFALNCSVTQAPPWEFFFYKENISSEFSYVKNMDSSTTVVVRSGGVYWCRGGRGDPLYFTEYSDPVIIENKVLMKAVVTLEHEWHPIFIGEEVTLRCNVPGAEWDYEWKTTAGYTHVKGDRELKVKTISSNIAYQYQCRGFAKHSSQTVTQWSDFFSMPVTWKRPQPTISVSQTWLTPGASITLSCSIFSSGWKFSWYRVVRRLSRDDVLYGYKKLPGSTEPTKQKTFVVHDQKHTEGYACSAVRGESVFESYISQAKFVWSEDPHQSVALRVDPNRVQHFRHDIVSLSCEGFSTEWRLRKCDVYECWVVQSSMKSVFTLDRSDLISEAVYWCESDIAFSNAVNITGGDDIILLSPAVPVLEGEKVILGCKTKCSIPQINFYKDHKVVFSVGVTEPGEAHFMISAISKSDEGFYKCGDAQKVSLQGWVSVTAASKQDQTFIILWFGGLILGVLLMFFLVLIICWRKKKDNGGRPRHDEPLYVNQSSAVAPPLNQTQTQTYCSLLHAHENTYETIAGRGNTEEGNPDEYDDIEIA